MTSVSPPPNTSIVPPPASTTPPPSTSSPPPDSSTTSPQPSSSPPPTNSSTTSPPPSTFPPPPTDISTTSPPPSTFPPPPPDISTTSPPPSTSSPPPDISTNSPPPSISPPPPNLSTSPPLMPQPNETAPAPSAPPPQSPPPNVPATPPISQSPPPPPPSRPRAPPPEVPSPPPAISPPPPNNGNSPPPASPSPPAASPPPPPRAISPSPPPPVASPPPSNTAPPLPSTSPPPPQAKPPENSPPPPIARPPGASPPSPSAKPPENSPPPSRLTPPVPSGPPPASPPSPNTTPQSPPPPRNEPGPIPPSPPTPPPPPPPSNSSSGGTPSIPVPPSPISPPGDPNNSSPSVPGPGKSPGGGGIKTGGIVAISVGASLILLSLIGLAIWFLRKQKKKAAKYNGGYVMPSPFGSSQQSDSSIIKIHSPDPLIGSGFSSNSINSPPEPGGLGNSRSWFTYQELLDITDGFSPQNLLGEGGFGCVYKGSLPDGREVAVKQLNIGGAQGEREFRAEVEIISRVHHRHLVSLVGYCISDHQRLLVYDYVPNNTLYYHLHGEGRPVLDWATRSKVATGAARGIAYLHEDCHPRIIHRDIKSSNILLDNNFEAQVSDFGLAKLALDSYTHVTTRVMGTFGYMAPEYATSGKLTEKSDVYSFGVVLLELITGRKPVDSSQPLGDESLVEWARPLLSHALASEEFEGLVDPKLEKNYVEIEMFRMIEAAAACVRHSGAKRPRMGQVRRALDTLGNSSDLSNGMKPGQSEVYDSAQQSAEIRLFRRMAFGSQDYSTDFFSQSSHS